MERRAKQQIVRRELVVPAFRNQLLRICRLSSSRSGCATTLSPDFRGELMRRQLFRAHFSVDTGLILNDPDAIRHVLVDAHERYGRTQATCECYGRSLGTVYSSARAPPGGFRPHPPLQRLRRRPSACSSRTFYQPQPRLFGGK